MSGHGALIVEKQDFSQNDLEEMKAVQYAENPALYYGRGIAPGSRGLQSGAVQRFEVRLKKALDQSRNCSLEDGVEMDVGRYSRASRLSHRATPAPTIAEDPRETVSARSKKQAFMTQSRTGPDA